MSGRLTAILLAIFGLAIAAACGDDDDGGIASPTSVVTTPSPTAAPHDSTTEPDLDGAASKFAIAQTDLPAGFLTDITATYVLTRENYSGTPIFESPSRGLNLLAEWQYEGGYETGYLAEGGQAAVLNGGYFFWVETHLFEDEEGAKAAFEYMSERLDESVSEPISASPVGNESGAWKAVGDPVGSSTIPSALHRVVFRRGNLVSVVATYGANPLMSIDTATELAQIVDEKALGEREAIEPTPTSNYTPPAASVSTPTPSS